MKSNQYDLCFSIGRLCGCAMYLRNCHLRLMAGPFDWLQGKESLLERVSLIENDCAGWLQKENLKVLPENFRSHIVYDKGSELTFRHDFPKTCSAEESLVGVENRYVRRIKRFYEKIANSRHVALVYLSVGETNISDSCILSIPRKKDD